MDFIKSKTGMILIAVAVLVIAFVIYKSNEINESLDIASGSQSDDE